MSQNRAVPFILALVTFTLAGLAALAAGPADSPAVTSFTADGYVILTTGQLGPTKVYVRCGTGTAAVRFGWKEGRVAPVRINGTLAFYPMTGDGTRWDVYEFGSDGPDTLSVDVITATKVDAAW